VANRKLVGIKGMGSLSAVTFCLGGAVLIAVLVVAVARGAFRGRIETLKRQLQQARTAPEARTGLPAEVLALALRV
jgi:hypothetical protein